MTREHRSHGPQHARSDSHDEHVRAHDRAMTPGRGTLAEQMPAARDADVGQQLGREAGTQLRMLAEQVRQTLNALEVATTDGERDAALDAMDIGVELAMQQVPDPQRERFRAELRTRVGSDAFDALGEELADSTGAHGARSALFLGIPREGADPGTALPSELRAKFETSLGTDLSSVRVHTGSRAERSTQALGARAFASGTNVHFGAGEYQPHTPDGEHLLAHEVAHTVQGGPAPRRKALVTGVADAAELEADHAADAMTSGERFSIATTRSAGIARTPHGHHGRRRGRRIDHSGDAAALDRQMQLHAGSGIEQLAAIRARATSLLHTATAQLDPIATAAVGAVHALAGWRSRIDDLALAQLDTDFSAGWSITTHLAPRIIGLLVRLNPVAQAIYRVVGVATMIYGVYEDAQRAQAATDAIGAISLSRGIASRASDTILRTIFADEQAAFSRFDQLYGQILALTSTESGTMAARTTDARTRQHDHLAATPGPVDPAYTAEVEATGIDVLRTATTAREKLDQLEVATRQLQAAPAQITTETNRILLRAQLLYGSAGTASSGQLPTRVAVAGTLQLGAARFSPHEIRLTIDPVDYGAHSTTLSGSLADLTALGVAADIRIHVTHPVDMPPVYPFTSGGITPMPEGDITTRSDAGGALEWAGMTDEQLGRASAMDYGSSGVVGDVPDAAERGAEIKEAVANALQTLPLQQLRDRAL